MKKILGILGLLIAVCALTSLVNPRFLDPYNLQNLIRWSSLFGVLSIGVAFVIVTGGIDLSIGSVVGLVGVLTPILLVERGWGAAPTLVAVLLLSVGIGLLHGLLVTKLRLQPFVVTLCGLLFYRGVARWLTDDQTLGFGNDHEGLRALAIGRPCSLAALAVVVGAAAAVVLAIRVARRGDRGAKVGLAFAIGAVVAGGLAAALDLPVVSEIEAPAPFLVLIGLAAAAGLLLNRTVLGRHLFAVGRNEQAARYSGIDTDRTIVAAYVLCSLLAGVGGILFALDVNSIQPAAHGNFYELYAIAAAVLGGCSLRGGEGTVLGVVIGATVMRVLYNSINLLQIPTQLEFAIIGAVILIGVIVDELVKRVVARRRRERERLGG